jgi:hypothetical protein
LKDNAANQSASQKLISVGDPRAMDEARISFSVDMGLSSKSAEIAEWRKVTLGQSPSENSISILTYSIKTRGEQRVAQTISTDELEGQPHYSVYDHSPNNQ